MQVFSFRRFLQPFSGGDHEICSWIAPGPKEGSGPLISRAPWVGYGLTRFLKFPLSQV